MTVEERTRFGELLRRYRGAAALSQEALAERAGLSRRGIADLERGARSFPHGDTAQRLAAALQLAPDERAGLLAAAVPVRRRGNAQPTTADNEAHHNLPRELTSFVGRQADIATVSNCSRPRACSPSPGPAAWARAASRCRWRPGSWIDFRMASGWSSWRRWLTLHWCQARSWRRWRSRSSRVDRLWTPCWAPCAPGSCCWSWTTASTCSTPAPGWPRRCCEPVPRCGSWPPAGSR